MTDLPPTYGLATHALHIGENEDAHHGHVAPIYQTATFTSESVDEFAAVARGDQPGYLYTRVKNPTVELAERKIAALEGWRLRQEGKATHAKVFPSGMSAISSAILAHVHAGDHIVAQDQIYGSTYNLLYHWLKPFGITCSAFDPHQPGALHAELEAHSNTRLVYIETPANPTLKIVDVAAVAQTAHARDVWLMIDNTFATPFCQRPLELGADIVAHSATKYLSGYGAIMAGAVVSPHADFVHVAIKAVLQSLGPSTSPLDAWLLTLGLKTFALRMERHCVSALTVARWLSQHPKVARVLYPGLETHPHHALAQRQMPGGFGGMLAFELRASVEATKAFIQRLRLPALSSSLGHVDTMIAHPASMSHRHVPPETRARLGVTDTLIRLSPGLEDVADIQDDLEQGLKKV